MRIEGMNGGTSYGKALIKDAMPKTPESKNKGQSVSTDAGGPSETLLTSADERLLVALDFLPLGVSSLRNLGRADDGHESAGE